MVNRKLRQSGEQRGKKRQNLKKQKPAYAGFYEMSRIRLAILGFFAQRADATGTHVLANQAPTLHDFNPLNIGFELAVGAAFGVAYIVSELGYLAADFTLCHFNCLTKTLLK